VCELRFAETMAHKQGFLLCTHTIGTQKGLLSFANSLRVTRKLLITLVPGAGIEPAPSYEERILSLK